MSRSSRTGFITSGLKGNAEASVYGNASNFSADNSVSSIIINDNGEAVLCDTSDAGKIAFLPGDDWASSDDPIDPNPMWKEVGSTFELPLCSYTVPYMNFIGWSVMIDNAEAVSKQPGESFVVTADTIVTAVWEPHCHSFVYSRSADGKTITAICIEHPETCDLPDQMATLTIVAPEEPLVSDGAEKAVTITGEILGVIPKAVYAKRGGNPSDEAPADAGKYTASISLIDEETGEETTGNVTASVTYTISPQPISISEVETIDQRDYLLNDKSVEILSIAMDGADLTRNTDYTVTGEMKDDTAGDSKDVTVTVKLLNNNYLPLESRIHEFQDGYYDAIAACHSTGNSNAFISFMLDKINLTLDWALQQVTGKDAYLSQEVQRLIDAMEYDVPYTGAQLMEKLSLKSRDNFRKLYLLPALELNLIAMSIPDKPTSRNQAYIRT